MPQLKRKDLVLKVEPESLTDDRFYFVAPSTGEVFHSYDHYVRRVLYLEQPVWQCRYSQLGDLTYAEAMEEEDKVLEDLLEAFPVTLVRVVEEAVKGKTSVKKSIDEVVLAAFRAVYETYLVGEIVLCRLPSDDVSTEPSARAEAISSRKTDEGVFYTVALTEEATAQDGVTYARGTELELPSSSLSRVSRVLVSRSLLRKFLRVHGQWSANKSSDESASGFQWLMDDTVSEWYEVDDAEREHVPRPGTTLPNASLKGKSLDPRNWSDSEGIADEEAVSDCSDWEVSERTTKGKRKRARKESTAEPKKRKHEEFPLSSDDIDKYCEEFGISKVWTRGKREGEPKSLVDIRRQIRIHLRGPAKEKGSPDESTEGAAATDEGDEMVVEKRERPSLDTDESVIQECINLAIEPRWSRGEQEGIFKGIKDLRRQIHARWKTEDAGTRSPVKKMTKAERMKHAKAEDRERRRLQKEYEKLERKLKREEELALRRAQRIKELEEKKKYPCDDSDVDNIKPFHKDLQKQISFPIPEDMVTDALVVHEFVSRFGRSAFLQLTPLSWSEFCQAILFQGPSRYLAELGRVLMSIVVADKEFKNTLRPYAKLFGLSESVHYVEASDVSSALQELLSKSRDGLEHRSKGDTGDSDSETDGGDSDGSDEESDAKSVDSGTETSETSASQEDGHANPFTIPGAPATGTLYYGWCGALRLYLHVRGLDDLAEIWDENTRNELSRFPSLPLPGDANVLLTGFFGLSPKHRCHVLRALCDEATGSSAVRHELDRCVDKLGELRRNRMEREREARDDWKEQDEVLKEEYAEAEEARKEKYREVYGESDSGDDDPDGSGADEGEGNDSASGSDSEGEGRASTKGMTFTSPVRDLKNRVARRREHLQQIRDQREKERREEQLQRAQELAYQKTERTVERSIQKRADAERDRDVAIRQIRDEYDREQERSSLRKRPLGKDRDYRKYFALKGVTETNSGPSGCSVVVQVVDHGSSTQEWYMHDRAEDISLLCESLDRRGNRERELLRKLEKDAEALVKGIAKVAKAVSAPATAAVKKAAPRETRRRSSRQPAVRNSHKVVDVDGKELPTYRVDPTFMHHSPNTIPESASGHAVVLPYQYGINADGEESQLSRNVEPFLTYVNRMRS